MKVSIIGAGKMGRAIATRALAGGNEVALIGKTADEARPVAEELGAEVEETPSGEVVILAVYFPSAMEAIAQHAEGIAGKVLVDITNPVNDDFTGVRDMPAGSGAQEIAAAAPEGTRVVKAFNTTFASTLAEGSVASQPLDVLVAADDDDAKAAVVGLVEGGGLRAVDCGPLAMAHYIEAAGFLHMAVQEGLGTGFGSALKILS